MQISTPTTTALPFYATGKRSRDLAREIGLSEAGLLAAHEGPQVARLRPEMAAIVEALPTLGEVMVLTRNEVAVHEKVGTVGGVSISGAMGLVVNGPIDLRLFLKHWRHAFALDLPDESGPRRSIQVFDASGEAVIKIHLRPASNLDAFDALRARFVEESDAAPIFETISSALSAVRPDAEAFRAEFSAMGDIHEFFPLLRRHGLDRRGALEIMGGDHVRLLGAHAATRLLEGAAESALPIMCFVGNRGCIQIHTGPVKRIKAMGPWINVLDPGFDLHLREDLVHEAFAVTKPTRNGLLTSVELYDTQRELVTQFFGVREPNTVEDAGWRTLVESLR